MFEDGLGVFGTSGDGPFATLLLSSVSLSDIFAFLFKFLSTFNYIILDLMFMVPGFIGEIIVRKISDLHLT